ncbi:zinc finger protein 665-like [Melitaea cinxia]|uniref:zinc finger protein 665-like n=1 Tax=Melitaea cinxia TaxID=113334 RepID=UPI001E273FF2|nr:zinc finger protein 665-like [Melitaea cinxia]
MLISDYELKQCDTDAGICWECKALITKFTKFKMQVLKAQKLIRTNLKNNALSNLKSYTKCGYDNIYDHDNRKVDSITVKEEISYTESSDTENFNGDESVTVNSHNELQDIKNETNEANEISREITKKLERHLKLNHKETKEKPIVKVSNVNKNVDIRDKIVKITLSDHEMLNSRELKRNQPNFKKLPFKCDTCVLGFMREDTCQMHWNQKHHEAIGRIKCDICSVRFTKQSLLSSHRERHYTIYKCVLCKYESTFYKAAVNHCQLKHDKDRQGLIHCGQCSVTVGTGDELTRHIDEYHMLDCNLCGQKFKKKNILRSHIIRIHSSNRAYICDVCSKTFKTKSRLETHITSHNKAIAKKMAYCSKCKVQYKNIHVYRNHLKNSTNHSERQYHCKECNKKFASKAYYHKHYDFFHLRKSASKCDVCDKIFISDWRLRNHKQKHHGLDRTRDHSCNVCDKTFYTLATLKNHKLTHSEERSYMCEDCGDTFKQRPALYTHIRIMHRQTKI